MRQKRPFPFQLFVVDRSGAPKITATAQPPAAPGAPRNYPAPRAYIVSFV